MSKYLIPLESCSAIDERWVVDHRYMIGLTKVGPNIGLLPKKLMKTKSSMKEKWDTCLVDLSNQKQCITSRKNCPYCDQEQSLSNIARHIQQYCTMRNNKDAVKKEHSTPDQKQIVGLNVSLSDSFKQPLPRKMLTKKI